MGSCYVLVSVERWCYGVSHQMSQYGACSSSLLAQLSR